MQKMYGRALRYLVAPLSCVVLLLSNATIVLALDVQYDTSFSGDGYSIIDGSPYITNEVTYDATVQTDGKMVVVGGHIPDTSFNFEGTIRRFNVDGTPDNSFGTSGVVSLDIGTGATTQFDTVAIQSDGKIVVAGEVISTSLAPAGWDRDAIVVRLTANGSLDTSFSSDGYEVYDSLAGTPYLDDNFRDMSLDSDQKIVMAGASGLVGVIVRLTSTGSLDSTFSTDGIEVVDIGGQDLLSSVSVDTSDNIYATGYSSSSSQDVLVVKLTSNGTTDSSFDSDGYATFDSIGGAPSSSEYGQNIEIDGSEIVVAGMTSVTGQPLSSAGFLARLTSNGSLDTTFSGDGIYVLSDNDWIEGLKLFGDFYYAIGADFVHPIGESDSSIWRFTRAGVLDTDFDSDGQFKLTELNHFADTWGILYGIDVLAGEIYVAGTPYDSNTSAEVTSIAKIVFGNQAVNIPADTALTDQNGDPITHPLSGTQTVRLESTALDVPVVEFSADFTDDDFDLSGVVVESSIVDGKAVVHGLVGTHTVFVPKRAGDNTVIICPDATTLAEVVEGCSNQMTLSDTDPNVDIITVNGQDFWRVSGLTGTGGLSTFVAGATLAPTGQASSMVIIVTWIAILTGILYIPGIRRSEY